MPIDRDFNLDNPDGITEEDIREMDRQADEIEEIAKRAEKAKEKIASVGAPIKDMSFAQLSIIDKALSGEAIPKREEKIKEDEGTREEDSAGAQMAGMGKEELMDLIIELMKTMEDAKEERKKINKKLTEAEKERKEFEKHINEIKSDISQGMGEINSFRANPMGFGKSKIMGLLGKAGIWGAVAAFVVQTAEQVYNQVLAEVKAQFGAGGVWDKRKLVEDVVTQYESINYLTKIKAGQVIFTADAGQELRQGAPKGVFNTRDLRDGHLRFIQRHFDE